jgi:hypothetical protein
MQDAQGGRGTRTQVIDILRHEIYPRDMKLMLFILLQLAVLLLAGLFGFNLRLGPDQRAVAEAEAEMAYRCFLATERVQLERDLQSVGDLTGGKQQDVLRRANTRIDDWILRRYGKHSARTAIHENGEGWATAFLADVARQRAAHPYLAADPQDASAVEAVLKRASALGNQDGGK